VRFETQANDLLVAIGLITRFATGATREFALAGLTSLSVGVSAVRAALGALRHPLILYHPNTERTPQMEASQTLTDPATETPVEPVEPTPDPVVDPTVEPVPEPTPVEPTPEPTPVVEPTPEPTPAPEPTPEPSPAPEPVEPEPVVEPTSEGTILLSTGQTREVKSIEAVEVAVHETNPDWVELEKPDGKQFTVHTSAIILYE
jgi:outer membrane biosynthesis protein TonB